MWRVWRIDESARGIWRRGERAAAWRMRRSGCRVIARNLRLGPGEIDLLCRHRRTGCYVLVEVKARIVSDGPWRPEDQLTAAKRRKLLQLAGALRREERVRRAGLRIDLVAVEFERGKRRPAAVRHYERAVEGG